MAEDARLIRCECGRPLGEWCAGIFTYHHRGREVVALGVLSIRCENCGRIWRPDKLSA